MDLIIIKISTTSTIIPPLLIIFVNFFFLGMGNESFCLDKAFWFPFDPNQPVGFFITLLFQSISTFAIFCFFTPIGCIFIGSCWSIETFLKDIARDISQLKRKKIFKTSQRELTKRICNFVRFHGDVEELSVDSFCETIKCDCNQGRFYLGASKAFALRPRHEYFVAKICSKVPQNI